LFFQFSGFFDEKVFAENIFDYAALVEFWCLDSKSRFSNEIQMKTNKIQMKFNYVYPGNSFMKLICRCCKKLFVRFQGLATESSLYKTIV